MGVRVAEGVAGTSVRAERARFFFGFGRLKVEV